jgi:UPF0176 protein
VTDSPQKEWVVAALYHFAPLDGLEARREALLDTMGALGVRGTVLLASEGINGTIAGTREGIDAVLQQIKSDPGLAGLSHKESISSKRPFRRARVRLKKEIVALGVPGTDPTAVVGEYVAPEQWNELISHPDVTLIDTRNAYEVGIGTFEGAMDPETGSFRDFPAYVAGNLDPERHKKVAMFCTGGIRCEKATSFMIAQGFQEVYHLKGGILKYLEEIPEGESMWRGECFVFDDRVAVNHDLKPGAYSMCHACRMPLSEEERASPQFEMGVSCPHCFGERSDEDRARYLERELQMRLAAERGEEHLGGVYRADPSR